MNESVRKKMALEVSIGDSEKTLKERLGTDALQVIAPRELTLQTRLSMNMSQLQSLDSERVDSYGHVGDLVISELQKRVFSLREALELPPCNASADLDELLSSTMETLHNLSPGKVPSTFSFLSSEGDQKSIFQRLQQFYKSLRDMEDTWVDSFDHKAGAFVEEKGANDASLNGQQHSSVSSTSTSALKRTDSKKNRSQGHKRKPSEDASNLEQLCQTIFETLDDISRRARNILEMKEDNECEIAVTYEISDCSESSQPFESADSWSDLNLESKVYSQAPLTPTSVLPESTQTSVKPRIFVNAFAPHLLWLPRNLVTGSSHPNCFKNLSANIGTQGLDPKHSLTTNLDKMQREQSSNPEKSTLDPALEHSLTTHLDKTRRNQPSNLRKRINGVNVSTWENPDSKCGVQFSKHNKPVGESNQPLKTITNTIQGTENSNNNTSTKLIFPPPTMVSTPPLPPPMVPTKSISLPPPMEVVTRLTPPPAPMVPANCLTKHSLTTNLDKMQREQPSNPEKSTQGLAFKHSLIAHSNKMQREQPSNSRKRINGVNLSTCENPDSRCGVQISKNNKSVGESNQPLKIITSTIQGTDNSNNNTSTKLIFPPPTTVSTPPLPRPMVPTKSLSLPPPMEVATHPPAPMVPAKCLTKHSLTTNLDKMQKEQPSNAEESTQGLAFKHSLTAHLDKMQREQPSDSRKRINSVNLSTCENPDSKCVVQISRHNKPVGESNQTVKIITSTIQGTDNSDNNTSTKLIFPPPTMVATPPLPPPMVPIKSLSLPPPTEVATPPPAPMVPAKCLTKHSLTTNLDKMQKEQPSNPEKSTQGLAFKHSLTAHLDKMQREQPSNSRKSINGVNLSTCENPDSRCGVQISKHNKPAGESNQPLKIITSTVQEGDNSSNNTSAKLIFPPPSTVSTPTPPPPMVPAKSLPLPPPPPMVPAKSLPLPPPPPPLNASKALRPRRSNTKLKRSSQIGNLYRVLKGKVEGAGQTGKSPQACRKLVRGGGNNGTQGMAEALAEITRRSSYFRQIEEDAQRFATQIIEMKHAIECFETRDMDALLKFHNYVELHLEDLTDETQVLARFESFPTKKLEVVRAAATLYSKLSSIADHLSTLQVVPPLSRQLDKVTCYFDKIKMEVETFERIKDEEAKRFERHKIFFDFNVLIRIKESMVDVSSSCIALALEESKATKAVPNNGVGDMMDARDDSRLRRCLKMLWRVFQLSFRVYNFAGGQDERAEELTCALAREMQTYPQQYWSI